MKIYQYAAENRLENRHHYRYTPFEGPDFLRAYFEQRENWKNDARSPNKKSAISQKIVDHIVGQLLGGETEKSIWKEHQYQILPAQPGEVEFVTRDLMLDLWFLQTNTPQESDTFKRWLEAMIQKFEISKRLHQQYGVDLKPIIIQYTDPANYALLAALAIRYYFRSSNPKYLNVTLKLLDLLSSLPIEQCDSAAREIGRAVTVVETKAIRQLIARQEVML